MASPKLLPLLTLTLCTLSAVAQPPPTPSSPPQYLVNAAETLADSGYLSMSLTLELIAPTLRLRSKSTTALTIFSPQDAAFSSAAQPSLPHLLLHFSPLSLSPASLLSFPFSSTIPSLSPSKHLIVTSNQPNKISINNVAVSEIPIFDDGFVIAYAIDDFFNFNCALTPANSTKISPKSDFQCQQLEPISHFQEAAGVLKSRGHSIMASFLELQLLGFLDYRRFTEADMKWTVFAPMDEDLLNFSGDFPDYFSLLMRHLVPCRVEWTDFEEMDNGTVVSINLLGSNLMITKDEDDEMVMVNGVEITFADMYDSEWLVIHGIKGLIAEAENLEEDMELMEDLPGDEVELFAGNRSQH